MKCRGCNRKESKITALESELEMIKDIGTRHSITVEVSLGQILESLPEEKEDNKEVTRKIKRLVQLLMLLTTTFGHIVANSEEEEIEKPEEPSLFEDK